MAIYHLTVKTFRRSSGQSATAAAAYRSGEKIVDGRTGEVHDYNRKGGVVSSELVLPEKAPQWAHNASELWNKAEQAEVRKNAVVAREFEVALPSELTEKQRRELAVSFAKELVKRHGFAAQVSIHKPGKEGDHRNHHAHILVTTRRLTEQGFTEKTRELDERINRGPKEILHWRETFAELQNRKLQEQQRPERVDSRTLKAQGIDREPTRHRGPSATAIERKSGQLSRLTQERTQQQQALEQARLVREQAAKAQEASEKRRIEQEQKAAAPKAPEPNRIPPRVVAWRGPSSKPTLPAPSTESKTKEPNPPRQDQEQTPAPELRQEEPPKPPSSEETAAQKRESALAAMRERAAQLKQKAQEPAPQPEPQKPPALDKEQLKQQMKERAAQLRQERQPAPQAPEKPKEKEKDRGPER